MEFLFLGTYKLKYTINWKRKQSTWQDYEAVMGLGRKLTSRLDLAPPVVGAFGFGAPKLGAAGFVRSLSSGFRIWSPWSWRLATRRDRDSASTSGLNRSRSHGGRLHRCRGGRRSRDGWRRLNLGGTMPGAWRWPRRRVLFVEGDRGEERSGGGWGERGMGI